jgi:hypothetical protein
MIRTFRTFITFLVSDKWKEGHNSGSLYGNRQLSLVLWAETGPLTSVNLAIAIDIFLDAFDVFIINFEIIISTETANLFSSFDHFFSWGFAPT